MTRKKNCEFENASFIFSFNLTHCCIIKIIFIFIIGAATANYYTRGPRRCHQYPRLPLSSTKEHKAVIKKTYVRIRRTEYCNSSTPFPFFKRSDGLMALKLLPPRERVFIFFPRKLQIATRHTSSTQPLKHQTNILLSLFLWFVDLFLIGYWLRLFVDPRLCFFNSLFISNNVCAGLCFRAKILSLCLSVSHAAPPLSLLWVGICHQNQNKTIVGILRPILRVRSDHSSRTLVRNSSVCRVLLLVSLTVGRKCSRHPPLPFGSNFGLIFYIYLYHCVPAGSSAQGYERIDGTATSSDQNNQRGTKGCSAGGANFGNAVGSTRFRQRYRKWSYLYCSVD